MRCSSSNTSTCDPTSPRLYLLWCLRPQDPTLKLKLAILMSSVEFCVVDKALPHLVSFDPHSKSVWWAAQVLPFCSCGNRLWKVNGLLGVLVC